MRLEFDSNQTTVAPSEVQESVGNNQSAEASQMLRAGIKAAQEGDRAEAKTLLLRVTELDPRNESAWLWLSSISEYPEELLVFLNNVLSINPDNERAVEWTRSTRSLLARTLVQRGIDATKDRKMMFARQCFEQALGHDENNEMAWLWMASVSESEEEKVRCFERVLAINPANESALASMHLLNAHKVQEMFGRAAESAVSGDRDAARETVDTVLELSPEMESAWVLKSHLARHFNERQACLERVAEINPENRMARSWLDSWNSLVESAGTPDAVHQAFHAEQEVSPVAETEEFSTADTGYHEVQQEARPEVDEVSSEAVEEPVVFGSVQDEAYSSMEAESQAAPEEAVSNFEMQAEAPAMEEQPQPVPVAWAEEPVTDNEPRETAADADESSEAFEMNAWAIADEPEFDSPTASFENEGTDEAPAAEMESSPVGCPVFQQDHQAADSFEEPVAETVEPVEEMQFAEPVETHEPVESYGWETPEPSFGATEEFPGDVVEEPVGSFEANEPESSVTEVYFSPEAPEETFVPFEEEPAPVDYHSEPEPMFGQQSERGFVPESEQFHVAEQESREESFETPVEPVAEAAAAPEDFYRQYAESNGHVPAEEMPVLESAAAEAPVPVAEHHAESLVCPFCSEQNDHQAFSCKGCRAVLTLSDIEMLVGQHEPDREKVEKAVRSLDNEHSDYGLDAEHLAYLGIGHINLRNWKEGYAYLLESVRRNPNNVVLSAQVNALAIRISEIREQEEHSTELPKNLRVLVVDDSPTVRKLISAKLEKSGHEVICAVDGLDAIDKINQTVPDLVLLDITMPRMDGYQVCKLIRNNEATKDVPVVMISGKDGFFDKVRGRMAGTTGYITKPFGPETLMKTVETFTNR